VKRTAAAIAAGLFILFFGVASWAAEGECRTSCKEGPKEYGNSTKWKCEFYTGRGLNAAMGNLSQERLSESSECILRIEGRLRSVDNSGVGKFKNFDDCFEQFCVPRVGEICGAEDRCGTPAGWVVTKERRYQ